MTRVYYREAVGAIVVYDVTSASTQQSVSHWKEDIDSKLNSDLNIPVVLFANKSDLLQPGQFDKAGAQRLASSCSFQQWFLTSAKTNSNVEEGINFLISLIMSNSKLLLQCETNKELELSKTLSLRTLAQDEPSECPC
eukprot:TRINITY_DN3154_c0_g1_i1.p1 TRINITY_DN3154_c0_g1~~TRINITY_DN3154_c0_g1_i1.p1  ORF type:complete len:138 (-),score=23.22 TRINITY_DN3154_c0_g1_i1:202-615(-)